MRKRRILFIKCVTFFQLFLLLQFTFAISFALNESSLVSAATPAGDPSGTSRVDKSSHGRIYDLGGGEALYIEYVNGKTTYTKIGNLGEKSSLRDAQAAVELAKDRKVDISPSMDFITKKTLQGSDSQLGGLQRGDDLGNGVTVESVNYEGGDLEIIARDATGKPTTLKGTKSTTVGKAFTAQSGEAYSYTIPGIGYVIKNFFVGNLVGGLVWSGVVVGAIQLLAPLLGADSKLTNALSVAAFAGIMSGKIAFGVFGKGGFAGTAMTPLQGGLIGVGIAVVVFVLLYKKESQKVVSLQCEPWEAPLKGLDCEKCNQDPLRSCSEYRCKSLGQACEIVNAGTSNEQCTWVSRNDVSSPIIVPWLNALSVDHKYTDMQGRPPSRGTKIVRTDQNCIRPFTALEFGLSTNEPSQCKIDVTSNRTFDEMQFYFGESNLYAYNHTQKLRLPSADSVNVESPELPQGGIYAFNVRCRDANGNPNDDVFVFEICVDESPDTTPPVIEATSIFGGGAVQFGAQSVPLTVFVNEPAECKWSIQDKTYDLMENTFSCSTHVYQQNAQQLYPCTGNLTGIKDASENDYYFRCKDQPLKPENERNVNVQGYKFTLKGTQTLSITHAGPNGTITGNTDVVPVDLTVRTDDGADEGKAVCYFSSNGEQGSFVTMFETNSFEHKQTLTLTSGTYNYYLRCVDAGGNAAETSTSFTVKLDRQAPLITRAYKEGPDALKIITDEDAQCVYSLQSCNYNLNEGIAMKLLSIDDRRTYAAEWKAGQKYYIKCADNYNNQPSPNSCTIVLGASSFS